MAKTNKSNPRVKLEILAEFNEIPSDDELSEILRTITGIGFLRKAELTIPKPIVKDLTKTNLY